MAKRVLSTICFKVSAGSSNDTGSSPSAITGKSSRGSVPSWKRARPATIVILPSAAASWTWLPAGSLRARANSVCAETVVAPGWATAAATRSLICRSRSVAISLSVPSAVASISTLDRIGMVLRRSTTDWTWLSPLSRVARSIVAFITFPRGSPRFRPAEHQRSGAIRRVLSLTRKRAGASAPALYFIRETARKWCGSEAHTDPGDDLMAIGIDAEIVGVGTAGIFEPCIVVVRVAILELGVGVAADALFDTRAETPAVEVEMLAERGGAVIGGQVEPLVGVAALGVDQGVAPRAEADAHAGIEVTTVLAPAIAQRTRRDGVVADLAGRAGAFAFGTQHDAAERDVIADVAAVEQAVGRVVVVADRRIRAATELQLVIAEQHADARAGEGGGAVVAVLGGGGRGAREGDRRGGGGEKKGTHNQDSIQFHGRTRTREALNASRQLQVS